MTEVIKMNSKGKCPHCSTVVRFVYAEAEESRPNRAYAFRSGKTISSLHLAACPECEKVILSIEVFNRESEEIIDTQIIWPTHPKRPISEAVPGHIAQDYKEAATVLKFSPKASAALSRRCLQAVLVEKGGVSKNENLYQQIGEIIDDLPLYLSESIDAIRNIGNFAAHQNENKHTGEIVNVEPGEAEWALDVLDLLFEYYYVQPAEARKKRDALNEKLDDMGKKPMLKPDEPQST